MAKDIAQNSTLFNNWLFASKSSWDLFRLSKDSKFLYNSVPFIIGKESLDIAKIQILPEMNRLVDKHVKYSLWNIPIILDMKNVTNLVLDSVTEVNFLKLVPLKESQSPGGKTVIPLAFDFNEKQTTYTFFTILDFLQSMGGF